MTEMELGQILKINARNEMLNVFDLIVREVNFGHGMEVELGQGFNIIILQIQIDKSGVINFSKFLYVSDPIIGHMHLLQFIQVNLRNLVNQVIIQVEKSEIREVSFGKFSHRRELVVGQ